MEHLTEREIKELMGITKSIQKLHNQLQKSSYYQKEQTYTRDDDGDLIPDDEFKELLPELNYQLVQVIKQFAKQLKK